MLTQGRHGEATYDDAHENPALFDAAIAPGFALERLPKTWALLKQVHNEADTAATLAKEAFNQRGPWGDPGLTPCEAHGTRKPTRSYPSRHAVLGWSVGMVLAELLPDRAPAILA